MSTWFNDGNWQPRPTIGLVAAHLAMTNDKDFQGLDVVMWSLVHEARISVIFPIIALCVTRSWLFTFLVAAIISEASRRLAAGPMVNLWYSPVDTLQFLILFVCGAAMAQKAAFIRTTISSMSFTQRAVYWIAALAALVSSTSSSSYSIFAEVGAAIVVALSFADTHATKLLSSTLPAWLGKISYSLYLIHLPVLFALVHLLWGRIPLGAILGIAVLSSLILADTMYRFIEVPSITLGRVLSARLTRRIPDLESAKA
jgi:peptidoglycan/LPS O-acetylase OafA/YrhL